ncbi:MAG: hypothetical protein LC099_01605 [Anaerolineales bacterium]|nr:hypothetical protein [Anaerolineales bacterium]
MKKARLALTLILLTLSLAALFWSLSPNRRETRIQIIAPTEMQLPTPSSFLDSRGRA